ncbi:MAG: hypothetical protein ACRC46_05395 [Thermoguttaceae bacterium]
MRTRTINFVIWFTMLSAVVFGAPNVSPNGEALLQDAVSQKKLVAILYTGSDWIPASVTFQKSVWEDAAFVAAVSPQYVLDVIDLEEKTPADDKTSPNAARREAFKTLLPKIDAHPAIVCYDSQGRILAIQNNVAFHFGTNVAATTAFLKRAAEASKIRDDNWNRATNLTGTEKSVALASGIVALTDLVPIHVLRESYKPIFEEIKSSDPDDASGYQRRFQWNVRGFCGEFAQLVADKKFDEAEQKWLAAKNDQRNAVLTTEQNQAIFLAGFIVYKNHPQRNAQCWEMLRDGVKLDPQSHLGLGMLGTLCYSGEGDVSIPYGWFPKDVASGAFDWPIEIGCRRFFSRPATYGITFNATAGKATLEIESVELVVGEQVFPATPRGGKVSSESPSLTLRIVVPTTPPDNVAICLRVKGKVQNPEESRGTIEVKPVLNLE